MQRKNLRFGKGFKLALKSDAAQAAEMVILPGDKEGDSENYHRGSDQWLFVISGVGTAKINGKKYPLRAGTLLLIEKKDRHEIRAGGTEPLKTLNIYVPPAYQDEDTPLSAGRPGG
jgi:mannose-6-phosphate isomerase-like protein (cupin superfamily)